jgi:hypothetical protein
VTRLSPLEELREVFGLTEGPTVTAQVLTTPSSVSVSQARQVARAVRVRPVIRDLAAVLARELSNEYQAAGLRPADYANDEEVARMLADRVCRALEDHPGAFAKYLAAYLSMSG